MARLYDTEYKKLEDIGIIGSKQAIVACVEQGTEEWFGLRLGVVSASRADNIVTTRGEVCKAQKHDDYTNTLICEMLTGQIQSQHCTLAMQRGTEHEAKARAWYELETGEDVQQVGFVYRDDQKQAGCSPDGLCAEHGLEIKVPLLHNQVKNVLYVRDKGKIPTQYVMQIQFSMWITGLSEWVWLSYCPEPQVPNVMLAVKADDKIHAALDEHVPVFCEELAAKLAVVRGDAQ